MDSEATSRSKDNEATSRSKDGEATSRSQQIEATNKPLLMLQRYGMRGALTIREHVRHPNPHKFNGTVDDTIALTADQLRDFGHACLALALEIDTDGVVICSLPAADR